MKQEGKNPASRIGRSFGGSMQVDEKCMCCGKLVPNAFGMEKDRKICNPCFQIYNKPLELTLRIIELEKAVRGLEKRLEEKTEELCRMINCMEPEKVKNDAGKGLPHTSHF